MFTGKNIIVLDVETAHSAEDCRHCGVAEDQHYSDGACQPWSGSIPGNCITQFSAIGWDNKPALGLSIGGYWDYADSRIHWFDPTTLEATVCLFVARQPLMVTFNGIGFDFPLMRGLLRRTDEEERLAQQNAMGIMLEERTNITHLCDLFKTQCATSYDILAEILRVDPGRKFERNLNSLEAIARANGLGAKRSHGAQAPRDWAAARYADVLNYCQDDVLKTKALFELIVKQGSLLRGDGQEIALPTPGGISIR